MPSTRYLAITTGVATWGSTATWSDSDGGVTGFSVPVSGDTVRWTRGNASVVGQDLSAVVLANFYMSSQGTLGSSGSPFKIGLADSCDSRFTGDYGDIYIAPYMAASTPGKLSFNGNGVGTVYVSNKSTAVGTINCGAMCRVVILGSYDGLFTVNSLGNTLIESNSTAAASSCTVITQSGRTTIQRATLANSVMGGNCLVQGVGAAGNDTLVFPAGVLTFQSSGAINNLVTYSGAVAQSTGAPGPITVTNSTKWGSSSMFDTSAVPINYTFPTQDPTGGVASF